MTEQIIDNIRAEGWEPIHWAAYYGNYNALLDELNKGICANLLTEKFTSLYKSRFNKKTIIYFKNMCPLYLAAQKGHTKCVKLLISRGANPKVLVSNTYTNTQCVPLNVSLWFNNFRSYQIMKKGSKKDALLNADTSNYEP